MSGRTPFPDQGTQLPGKPSRSMPFQNLRVPERPGQAPPEPDESYLGVNFNERASGEVTREARIPGWTVQRPRTRRYLPAAIVNCVACWDPMDPNDVDQHRCRVVGALHPR